MTTAETSGVFRRVEQVITRDLGNQGVTRFATSDELEAAETERTTKINAEPTDQSEQFND